MININICILNYAWRLRNPITVNAIIGFTRENFILKLSFNTNIILLLCYSC